jgi:hypothetical protein
MHLQKKCNHQYRHRPIKDRDGFYSSAKFRIKNSQLNKVAGIEVVLSIKGP